MTRTEPQGPLLPSRSSSVGQGASGYPQGNPHVRKDTDQIADLRLSHPQTPVAESTGLKQLHPHPVQSWLKPQKVGTQKPQAAGGGFPRESPVRASATRSRSRSRSLISHLLLKAYTEYSMFQAGSQGVSWNGPKRHTSVYPPQRTPISARSNFPAQARLCGGWGRLHRWCVLHRCSRLPLARPARPWPPAPGLDSPGLGRGSVLSTLNRQFIDT